MNGGKDNNGDKGGNNDTSRDAVQNDKDTMDPDAFNDKYGIVPGEPYSPVPGNPDDKAKH